MEFICFLFFMVAVFAAKSATKAARKAAKTSGAARGLWNARKQNILDRLHEQEERAHEQVQDLQERAALFEPPPAPRREEVLEEAEEVLKNWGADPAIVVEELPSVEEALQVPVAPEPVAPEPVAPEPAPPEPVAPEPVADPTPAPSSVVEPTFSDLEPFLEVEEEFFDPLVDPAAVAFGGGLAAGAAVAALQPEAELPAPAQDHPGGAELLTLVEDLFDSGRPGFEVKEIFENEHLGRSVRWRAMIDRVEPFQRDELLQDGPGVRVVTEFQPEDPSARRVRVDLGVDADTGALLERGKSIAFVGELSACDPYLHSFTVRDARLI